MLNDKLTKFDFRRISFALYLKECIEDKLEEHVTTTSIEAYFDSLRLKSPGVTISVTSKTVDLMVKSLERTQSALLTKVETLEKIAVLFGAAYKTSDAFWQGIGRTKNGKRYLPAAVALPKRQIKATAASDDRLKALLPVSGQWQGKSFEPDGQFPLRFDLYPRPFENLLDGIGDVYYMIPGRMDEKHHLEFRGKLVDNCLHLHYQNRDKSKNQAGSIYLTIEDNGNKLSGYFLGQGYPTGTVVRGDVEMTRISSDIHFGNNN